MRQTIIILYVIEVVTPGPGLKSRAHPPRKDATSTAVANRLRGVRATFRSCCVERTAGASMRSHPGCLLRNLIVGGIWLLVKHFPVLDAHKCTNHQETIYRGDVGSFCMLRHSDPTPWFPPILNTSANGNGFPPLGNGACIW